MNEGLIMPETGISFKDYLLKNKRNRMILLLAGIAIIIQFSIFKYFYPFASFLYGDSFAYLKTAYFNLDINNYMVGYARFLRFFSVFTTSDTALVAFTYLLIQVSGLFLLFTIYYFYRPSLTIQIILLCFFIFSPLSLHLSNFITSDGFFLALSLLWFSLLLWLVYQPSRLVIIVHAAVLFIAFTVRYNALIYPFISASIFVLSKLSVKEKILGFGAAILLCLSFVFYTSYKYKQLTGYWQYSPFSGWQLANNAMYTYRYVDSSEREPVLRKYQVVDKMIREYFDSTRDVVRFPHEAEKASTFYMWTPGLPLWNYRDSLFKNDTSKSDYYKWASVGPLFKEYGSYIIQKYPWHFAKFFLWPNAQRYYAPPIEFLESYNTGRDSAAKLARVWFRYKTPKIYTRFNDNRNWSLNFYPIFSGLINVVIVCCFICYLLLQGWKTKGKFRNGVLIAAALWISNAGFTILASPASLRFQSFPLTITTTFVFLLMEWLWFAAFKGKEMEDQLIGQGNNEQNISSELLI